MISIAESIALQHAILTSHAHPTLVCTVAVAKFPKYDY